MRAVFCKDLVDADDFNGFLQKTFADQKVRLRDPGAFGKSVFVSFEGFTRRQFIDFGVLREAIRELEGFTFRLRFFFFRGPVQRWGKNQKGKQSPKCNVILRHKQWF